MLRQVFRSLVRIMPNQNVLIQNQQIFRQTVAQISFSNSNFAKKKKHGTKNQKIELVEVDDDDDDVDDDVDEKIAMAAKGIIHKGVGEAEEVVDDGLPKDYKRRILKLGSRRLDTLLNRTSGRSSAEVEKMILTGRVRINEQIVKKKAHNINKKDEIDVWLETLDENSALANVHRIKIIDYVLKQNGYDIDAMVWSKVIVENWKQSQEWASETK